MQLSVWTYEGPPHVGVMRVAASMRDVHLVLHAPQGDTYADLLFTMIERRASRPPVTYTTFQARDLGRDTANLFMTSVATRTSGSARRRCRVRASCTAELIQDDPGGSAGAWAAGAGHSGGAVGVLEEGELGRERDALSHRSLDAGRPCGAQCDAALPARERRGRCNILGPRRWASATRRRARGPRAARGPRRRR